MNSSNVTKCEVRLKIYLYPHMKNMLQWLHGYGEPTNLLASATKGVEGGNGVVVWLPLGTNFQSSPGTHLPSSYHVDSLLMIDWFWKNI